MSEKQIIRIADVEKMTGLSRPTIYLHIRKDKFPRQIKLGPRASGWLLSDVQAWIDSRIEASK
ncbi:AlpA family transcriptional regulator [Cupriavidus taiwanensis]|uniref:helix-turn-helix transcriptional regulator n=1 Tax=Cupriavidus taiwanensis TaxID=164546 RepID=UPI002541E87E|nr:AlpA family transcriptional regulator [Cupriavidus taiwanensis]MDK3021723.1 AlpA family transcriptional regulator [Cupriavidus taiwanensis]